MAINLPPSEIQDSAAATKLFFDVYGKQPLEFSSNDVEAAIGFFESRGFDKSASIVISATILKQAKLDNTPVFSLLDTLKALSGIQLSALIGEILNNNRPPTSTLGFRVSEVSKSDLRRNISA